MSSSSSNKIIFASHLLEEDAGTILFLYASTMQNKDHWSKIILSR